MLRKKSLYAVLGSLMFLTGAPSWAEIKNIQTEDKSLNEVDIKKLSEAFGNFIGKNLKSSGLNFDVDSLITGIKNGSEGKPSPLTDAEYEKGMLTLQEKAMKRLAEDNLKSAENFLKENASKPNMVVLEPGKLEYTILQKGSGEEVKEHSAPTISYKGEYLDGTVFGSSEDAGGPISLPLDQTIPGFAKGIVGMKEGEKRKLFVHPDLGYGTTGHLPPNSLLIFEVEVIKAKDADSNSKDFSKDGTFADNDDVKAKKKSDSSKDDDNSDDDDDDYDEDEDIDDDDDDNDEDDAPLKKSASPSSTTTPANKK